MFQEEIADLTANHLATHIRAYLDAVQALYPDNVVLQSPKSIETANLAGGVYNATPDEMPAIAVDIIDVEFSTATAEGLWLYKYSGHIAEVVSGNSETNVNREIKRHQQAVEKWVNDHQYLHQLTSTLGNDFKLIALGFLGSAFSGAEKVNERDDRPMWIAGYRIDLEWFVSQPGPNDHGS